MKLPPAFGPRRAAAWLLAGAALLAPGAHADTEATTADGRRVLLKEDGTWKYIEEKPEKADKADKADKAERSEEGAQPAPAYNAKQDGEGVLQLERRVQLGRSCSFVVSLQNALVYEIVSIVPYLTAWRANGAAYQTESVSFQSIRPGNRQERTVEFLGITCDEIARLQVVGGERCEMGELNKFSDVKGQCLARLRVAPSTLVRFEK
jgi:hypothetical protein